MARAKILVSKEALQEAILKSKSANNAANILGLTYQTFERRCKEHGVEMNKNPSGKGLTAEIRYGTETAKRMAQELSVKSAARIFSKETRERLRDHALVRIEHGKMPSRGLKGYYQGIWFDSSWELAYYLWMQEQGETPKRNTKIWFDYIDDIGIPRRTKPDFVLPNGDLVEIKGYPNKHTEAKYRATKNKVRFLFRKDLKDAIAFAQRKFGKDFAKRLYASVGELVDPAE